MIPLISGPSAHESLGLIKHFVFRILQIILIRLFPVPETFELLFIDILCLQEYYNYLEYEKYFVAAYPLTQKIYEIVNAYYIPCTSRKSESMSLPGNEGIKRCPPTPCSGSWLTTSAV